jgi:hypothetical protein
MTDKEQPPSMILTARFDIDQVGANLEWHFSRKDHEGNPIEGKDAGSIYFTKGEKFFVHVTGGAKQRPGGGDPFKNFKILDCCLISRPQLSQYGPNLQTRFYPPSPFVAKNGGAGKNATVRLPAGEFKNWIGGESKPGYYKQTLAWEDYLVAEQNEGRWELSFIVTVAITGSDGAVTERVFCFDPEATVGTGMNPP